MSRYTRIGFRFSDNSPVLDLLPGRSLLPRDLYSIEISYVSIVEWHEDGRPLKETTSSHIFMETGDSLKVIIGDDVHSITYSIRGRDSNKNMNFYAISIRVDKLILLNLANKFFNLTVPL